MALKRPSDFSNWSGPAIWIAVLVIAWLLLVLNRLLR
jgi:hypothetical protein